MLIKKIKGCDFLCLRKKRKVLRQCCQLKKDENIQYYYKKQGQNSRQKY